MTASKGQIHFLLNDQQVCLEPNDPLETLLDFLRLKQNLCGTKEGCAEGDCGACTVLVGRLNAGQLVYETVNACIRFVGSLNATHVVTVEHLRGKDGALHPVQQAMVDYHGSQCGFCTPGSVMSLYALWMQKPKPSRVEIERALQGNLCRCTGYAPIITAASKMGDYGSAAQDALSVERTRIKDYLTKWQSDARIELGSPEAKAFIPKDVADLAALRQDHPDSTLIAGATDVGLWVTKHMRNLSPAIFINHLDELQRIEEHDDGIWLGAGVSYQQAADIMLSHFPQLDDLWWRIGGAQVRAMGTIGGNIANGSPIGDTPPPLIVLGATVTLRKGVEQRQIPLEEFFIQYGKQDRRPGDFVEGLFVPFLKSDDLFSAYKISKRRDEDISALCGAFRARIVEDRIKEACIAFGGMAGIPQRAKNVELKLIGQPWSEETILDAMQGFTEDFTPLSDWRASSDYRLKVAQNLLLRFFAEHTATGEPTRLDRFGADPIRQVI